MHICSVSLIPNPLHLLPAPLRSIAELQLQLILLAGGFQGPRDVDVVSNMHVAGLEDELSIEVHGDYGVEAVEDEGRVRGSGGWRGEGGFVGPVGVVDPV